MFSVKTSKVNPDQYLSYKELRKIKTLAPILKTDADVKELVYAALWKDDVLRALDYMEIDVNVISGVVYLNGHLSSTSSQERVGRAIKTVPGILDIKNNLVMDDFLTTEVASSLGTIERTYNCKFSTGASHGVISLNGTVINQSVKLLAEKCVAVNPKVRGVINNIYTLRAETGSNDDRFLQPTLGENIHFLDGISGVVKQVIIDPNNRLVIAMTVLGRFTSEKHNHGELPEDRLIVLRMSTVRYLTREAGFLYISSDQRDRYKDFDSADFILPNKAWMPPYPYFAEDVLLPVRSQEMDIEVDEEVHRFPFADVPDDELFKTQAYLHNNFDV